MDRGRLLEQAQDAFAAGRHGEARELADAARAAGQRIAHLNLRAR
jgi:hypothetical protein